MSQASTFKAEANFSSNNALSYALDQFLLGINTSLPCEIISIKDNRYTIRPLINIINAKALAENPPLIHNVPYSSNRGGNAGFIIEPKVGDAVLVVFSQRDITTLKKQWKRTNPTTYRKMSLADAIIVKNLSNTEPDVFVKVTDDGIVITAPEKPVQINAQNVEVNADEITLGAGANLNVLLQNTPITATITGVHAGSDTVTTTFTASAGGSSVVQGAL
jgi:hypothetical protein